MNIETPQKNWINCKLLLLLVLLSSLLFHPADQHIIQLMQDSIITVVETIWGEG